MTLQEMERRATLLRRDPLADLDELAALEQAGWKPRMGRLLADREAIAADGVFYRDTREPFMGADPANPITLATTDKALIATGALPGLGKQYFARVGKKVKIRAFGKITTAATPGNGTFAIYWGTNADATGTILASSAAQTLIAAQTNLSWMIELWIKCVTPGAAGTLFCTGRATFNTAVIAAGTFLIPASAAVVSAGVDLTADNAISLQFKRSGNTVETMSVQDYEFEALN